MAHILAQRAFAAIAVVWLTLTATFFIMLAAPGHPTALYSSPAIPPSSQVELTKALGLDQRPVIQYLRWLSSTVQGNLGFSLNLGRPVADLLQAHLGPSLLLGTASLIVAVLLGTSVGTLSASLAGSPLDITARLLCVLLYSVPTFWIGLVGLRLLSYETAFLPPGHMHSIGARDGPLTSYLLDTARHLVLPALVVGISLAPAIARLVRIRLIEVLADGFITAARARGLSPRRILIVHALPLSLAPVFQVVGLSLPMLAGGVLVTEVVFSWPGMGRLTYLAIATRDYPLILGTTAVITIAVAGGGLVADLMHAAIDPRVRSPAVGFR